MGIKEKQPLAGSSSETGDSADASITADRYELKYALSAERARSLLASVNQRLIPHVPPHVFPTLDQPVSSVFEQDITTIYLDTTNRDIYRACLAGDADEKLRIKEYRPSGARNAQSESSGTGVSGSGFAGLDITWPELSWIEVKKSRGSRTQKDRIPVPQDVIQQALATGDMTLETILAATRSRDLASKQFLQRLWRIQRHYRRPLRATCIVEYRRSAWQDQSGTLRITVDSDLRVSLPSTHGHGHGHGHGQGQHSVALVPAQSEGASHDSRMILEVKYHRALPAWLKKALHALPPARLPQYPTRPFSKFLAASEVVSQL